MDGGWVRRRGGKEKGLIGAVGGDVQLYLMKRTGVR